MSPSEKSFTVSDRRHFTAEGRPREEAEDPQPAPSVPAQEPEAPRQPRERPPLPDEQAVDLSRFLLGLAAEAGRLIAGEGLPDGTDPAAALGGARSIVAILEMLKDKTEGRRTPEEDSLLTELLFQLRMAYVERTRAGQQ